MMHNVAIVPPLINRVILLLIVCQHYVDMDVKPDHLMPFFLGCQ